MTMTQVQEIEAVRGMVKLYRVTLESGTVWMIHSGTLKRLGLYAGMLVDEDVYAGEIQLAEAAEGREFALRSLTSRGRTAEELTGILIRKGFSEGVAAQTIAWVQEKGLIEEDILLEDTVESLMKRKGINQVRQILNQRGFSKAEAERVLKEKNKDPEHYEQVLNLSRKKMKELQTRYPQQWAQRLGSWLYSKGHDGDLIRRVLTALKHPDSPEDE